jgi:hypothetical protein
MIPAEVHVGILDGPDFEQMRHKGDFPRLVDWALYTKEPKVSRAALASLRKDVPALVEYLYETAAWAQDHAVGRRKMLPQRSIKMLDQCVSVLVKLGAPAVDPLVAAVRAFDEYGDEQVRVLFQILAFECLQRIGAPAGDGLRWLAEDPHDDVAQRARDVVEWLDARGLLDDDEDDWDEEDDLDDEEPVENGDRDAGGRGEAR